MNVFRSLKSRLGMRSGRASGRRARGRSRSRSRSAAGSRRAWWFGAGVVVVVLGIGLLNWARTGRGRATLLSLGSEKMYGEVQAAVDSVLVRALPGLAGGPAVGASGGDRDYDWPAPAMGAGAAIRCRAVSVPSGETWWEVQARLSEAVAGVGARILWGERLVSGGAGGSLEVPSEERDLLRLDIGVTGRPTHTLVLGREGAASHLQWGNAAGLSQWRELAASAAPTVALIIDDWGHGKTPAAMSLLDLPVPLTMAVLPGLSYSRYFALRGTDLILPPGRTVAAADTDRRARARRARLAAGCPVAVSVGARPEARLVRRREIMLHLPMEPQGYPEVNPGADPVLVGMSQDEIRTRLQAALAMLPQVNGVNNHMGSAATSDVPTMRALMPLLKERDLFFVDSLTSARSVAYAEAVRAGVPAARNRIFLDYDDKNEAAIATNLERLVSSARAAGFAVGIGHPHPATAAVLAREIPRLTRAGVRFVTVSELMALREFEAAIVADRGDG